MNNDIRRTLGTFTNKDNVSFSIVFPSKRDILLGDYATETDKNIYDFRILVDFVLYNRKANIVETILTTKDFYIQADYRPLWYKLYNTKDKEKLLNILEKLLFLGVAGSPL